MARQEYRNNLNILIGWRQKQGDHDVGYNHLGQPRGFYEPKFNGTKDLRGVIVSRGDNLAALIVGS